MCVLLAGAIQTPVLGARCAGPQKLLTQSRTRAVSTDPGIRGGEAVLLGELLYALLSQVNSAKDLCVLGFEPVQDAMKTGADLILKLNRWLSSALKLPCPCLKRPVFRSSSSIAVNHRIAEQAIEPGRGRFVGLEVVSLLEGAQVCGLENVFSQP